MPDNYYDDLRALADGLIAHGYEALGEEVKRAVETGSTSSEILMRLRVAFTDALEREALSGELRSQVACHLEAANRVLP